MRRWRTNRVKLAGIITKIDGYILHLADHNTTIEVDIQYLRKHRPLVGGYFIMYEDDGYQSFCPADVFERNHQEADPHTRADTQYVPNASDQNLEMDQGMGTILPRQVGEELPDEESPPVESYEVPSEERQQENTLPQPGSVLSVLERDHHAERHGSSDSDEI